MPDPKRLIEDELDELSERPLTAEEIARMPRAPRARTIRLALGLTRAEFAARYRISPETLTAWESRRSEPDAVARAFLEVIAAEPEATARALMGFTVISQTSRE